MNKPNPTGEDFVIRVAYSNPRGRRVLADGFYEFTQEGLRLAQIKADEIRWSTLIYSGNTPELVLQRRPVDLSQVAQEDRYFFQ